VRRTGFCVKCLMLIAILGLNKIPCVGSYNRKPYRVDTRLGLVGW
jgi:hypothetical protein